VKYRGGIVVVRVIGKGKRSIVPSVRLN
jgi:hypothetical protein